ncbi:type IV secretory system conjugative DNA transfer family protein [Arsenophonus nasoniae]|uniref:Type IV secretory system conjugative DNA transfer family protein n=1 Tax=Arsenophonus nasoniae TaxID=638 RepID=A0ABY8NYU7_9GAMM|nr:type IV secretory system conjugative DNA transfer family protein [Arsenophonus nasoniae]WGM09126.1 type IV secretory system conjugative DNA transfer family protein [Arsenophonus nasoniae]
MEKKTLLIIFFLILFGFCLVASLYTSSMALLKATHYPVTFETVKWDLFLNTYQKYGLAKPYLKTMIWGIIGGIVPIFLYVVLFVAVLIGLRKKKTLHGNARLANDVDLAKSGFFPKAGKKPKHPAILIGKMPKGHFKGSYISYSGQQFLMLYAPTRSGKGVGIVIPNCLHFPQSLVVLDIKLENFLASAGHRKDNLGQEVYLFCPDGYADSEDLAAKRLRTHRYNPLFYIRRDPMYRFGDLSKIAAILFPLTGDKNDMWTDLSANVFNALVLFLLDCENEMTITETEKTLADGSIIVETQEQPKYKVTLSQVFDLSVPKSGLRLGEWFEEQIVLRNSPENIAAWQTYLVMPEAKHSAKPALNRLSDETVTLMRQFSAQKDEQQQSILLTFNANMKVFANPITAAATDGNDFDLREVRRKKMTIYYGLAPSAIDTYARLTNLFFSQLLSENVRTLPEQDATLKYQCLMLLDEFTSMGRLDVVQVSLAFTAGYNMRFVFILQNREQLMDAKKGYGKEGAGTILENCAVELIYPPKKVNEATKQISETIGYIDMKMTNKGKSTGKSTSRSTSESIQKRAVLLPQEIVELRDVKHKSGLPIQELVISEFCRPFIAHKIISYDEPFFVERRQYAQTHIPDIPILTVEEDEVARAIFMMQQREKTFAENNTNKEDL